MKVKDATTNYCMRITNEEYQFLKEESQKLDCSVNQLLKILVMKYREKIKSEELEKAFSQIGSDEQDIEYALPAQAEVIHESLQFQNSVL
jgi:hypothetical protein